MSDPSLTSVSVKDVEDLYQHFRGNPYSVPYETPEAAQALARCKAMLELDYNVVEIDNAGGVLCAHYPSKILICQSEKSGSGGDTQMKNNGLNLETESDVNFLRHQMMKARKGRCRARFPVPVILYNGKHICRSGTTALSYEIYGRTTCEVIWNFLTGTSEDEFEGRGDENDYNDEQTEGIESTVRKYDIKLLRRFNVNTIFDLMVEYQKVKYGMYVTSSEQADKENRYRDFNIINVPYPGCEFFSQFHDNGKKGQNLVFKWLEGIVYKTPTIPGDVLREYNVDWEQYKTWDIPTLTTNYLAAILRHLNESDSGILVHCISGWDRTPLYISLLRLSLWADGLIHKSLTSVQMLYFTIAYDWMLFGHNLKNRLAKCEEIFFFCFYVLKYIMLQKCSLKPLPEGALSPQRDSQSADNGNFDFLDENFLSLSPNASNPSPYHFKRRESETDIDTIMESDTLENENNFLGSDTDDLSIDSRLLDQSIPIEDGVSNVMDVDNSDSQSSNESNGNNADIDAVRRRSVSPVQNSPDVSPRSIGKSSPLPMTRSGIAKDDSSNNSWTFVTSTGSVHSNDSVGPRIRTLRGRKLTKLRNDIFKIYYHSESVPYNRRTSALGQMIENLVERVGFSS